jgi:hypothetical protein
MPLSSFGNPLVRAQNFRVRSETISNRSGPVAVLVGIGFLSTMNEGIIALGSRYPAVIGS